MRVSFNKKSPYRLCEVCGHPQGRCDDEANDVIGKLHDEMRDRCATMQNEIDSLKKRLVKQGESK